MQENAQFLGEEVWKDYDPSGNIMRYKVPMVKRNIPGDVKSILDVGCGNGIITNILGETYQVVGADFSAEALKRVQGKTLQCSCDDLPVEDQSYDMVFSSQLLEHLHDDVLEATLNEFRRVARKYLLLTVPNSELLARNEVKCPECGTVFNCIGHFQSFTHRRIQALVGPGFDLVNHETSGASFQDYHAGLMKIRQQVGNRYFHPSRYTECPKCKNTQFPTRPGNLVSKLANGLNRVVSPKKPYWLLVLFERNKSA